MSYKALKKIINSLANLPSSTEKVTVTAPPPEGAIPDSDFELDRADVPTDTEEAGSSALTRTPREFSALKTAFFYRLERELEKVNTFYLHKEAELKVRLRTFVDKKRILLLKRGGAVNVASLGNLREAFLQYVGELTKLQVRLQVSFLSSLCADACPGRFTEICRDQSNRVPENSQKVG